jgi:hypothetical protein
MFMRVIAPKENSNPLAERYHVVAYISPWGVRDSESVGARTFPQVFIDRPDKYQYVVLQDLSKQNYILVDMYGVTVDAMQVYMGEPMYFPTADAAIAAGVMKSS